MVVQPDLLIPLHSIVNGAQLLLRKDLLHQRPVLLWFLDFDIPSQLLLIDQDIGILAGRAASPLIGHEGTAVALVIEEGRGEGGDSGIIEFYPSVAFLDNAVVVSYVGRARVHDDALEI